MSKLREFYATLTMRDAYYSSIALVVVALLISVQLRLDALESDLTRTSARIHGNHVELRLLNHHLMDVIDDIQATVGSIKIDIDYDLPPIKSTVDDIESTVTDIESTVTDILYEVQ